MGKDYGESIQHNPDFNGPIYNRSCTDILFLIAFILFLGVWGFVGLYSLKHGGMEKLLAPMDSQGRRCGLDPGLENKKKLVFFNIVKCIIPGALITGCPTTQVCVDKCPDRTILFDEALFNQYRSSMVCTEGINVQTLTWNETLQYINEDKCTGYVISSQPVVNRCFVNVTEAMDMISHLGMGKAWAALDKVEVLSQISSLVQFNQLSAQIVQDLVQSRWYLLGALVAVIVICFVYILLLRWVVAPVVWISIAGFFAVLGFSLCLCYKNYAHYKAIPIRLNPTTNLMENLKYIFRKHVSIFISHTQTQHYYHFFFFVMKRGMVILVAVAVFTVILLLIVIFLRKRITLAIAFIREGSKAVFAVKSTVFFPIFPWIVQCFVIAYGLMVLMCLTSIGESAFKVVNLQNDTNCNCNGVYKEDFVSCNPVDFIANCRNVSGSSCEQASCMFTGIDNPLSVVWLHLINLLGFFWTMFFISGIADMMLASTFSTWYWTFHKHDLPFFTLTSGIYRTVRYHMGTVAFGALIIAIVRVIRVILEYIDHKLKKFDNAFTRCIMCFCKCFFWCLESFLKFINKNAYIMCAVHGKNFCSSARDAFSLLMRNIVRVVVLDKVTNFIFFLSKGLITISVGFCVYYVLESDFVYEVTQGERLHYNYIPAIILSIATYFICTIFFNVYAMAVDTLFLCFLEDCERNNGSAEKPYFMSKNLMKILGKRNLKY